MTTEPPRIPPFRTDGYLPVGLHLATEPEVLFRFGSSNRQRRSLAIQPEEIFAAEDGEDWEAWVAFFSRTRELDSRRKGLVEVEL